MGEAYTQKTPYKSTGPAPIRSGGNLPPYLLRIRMKLRPEATKMRSHRSGGLQAAMGRGVYAEKPRFTPRRFVSATPMAADCRRYERAGLRAPYGIVHRIRNAHGGRLPPLRTGGIACSLRDCTSHPQRPWRQIAAATDLRDCAFLTKCYFVSATPHGGLPPFSVFGG